jgi:arylsulfatase A-like enzyme
MKSVGLAPPPPSPSVPNTAQEDWMSKAADEIVLPHFRQNRKPFILLFWSRDPDFSQHNGKDSIGAYQPGINGPSGKAGIRNADTRLGELIAALKTEGLDKTTDIFVTADHGFTTISHASAGRADLPSSFLAADLAAHLNLPQHSGLLGKDPAHPQAVVAADGNSDQIYLPGPGAQDRAQAIVSFLLGQNYVSGIFVNDSLGGIRGTLPMSMLNLIGSARTPVPAIYVNFRTFTTCADALQCTVGVSDTPLATGQGNHGSFSRAETRNFMAAMGPDFKKGFADPAPVSNADIAPTLAQIMGFALPARGKLVGRVASEALTGGKPVQVEKHRVVSEPDPNTGLTTVLEGQSVGDTRYFDAAGFDGRTVGLTKSH